MPLALSAPNGPPVVGQGFLTGLLRQGLLSSDDLLRVLATQRRDGTDSVTALLALGCLSEDRLYPALAAHWQTGLADLAQTPPDPALLAACDPRLPLRDGLLPWRRMGGVTVIATSSPALFLSQRAALAALFGPVIMALAPQRAITQALQQCWAPQLTRRAETRVAADESCRHLALENLRPVWMVGLAIFLIFVLYPTEVLTVLTLLALAAMLGFTGLKLAALFATPPPGRPAPPRPLQPPMVSLIVALYRESCIAGRLVERLGQLGYPAELLDILLVVEAADSITQTALAATRLPPHMRVIVVPGGTVQTKPRALNYALDHCRGGIVGVYDAEDAPAPDQVDRVVARFVQAGPDLACLQGMLDFYNPQTNWLSRCFTIEYAGWFRLFLPGLQRLKLAVPLGGTTLFFRREALEVLGGWDAHNVTEDADLGMRIARHGYRTEVIETVTLEEANCRPLPWIKQRSRWIKGFMITWLTHMRQPLRLWRQLGPRRFAGFQLLFLGSVLQALLAPVLWSFWLVPMGLPHPVAAVLPGPLFTALYITFFMTELLSIGFGIAALARTGHRISRFWVPSMPAYNSLATFAAYKAAWELLCRPFYWDKTSHGHFGPGPP